MRKLCVALMIAALSVLAHGQTAPITGNITTASAGAGNCVSIRAQNNSAVGIIVSGTWSGTLTPNIQISTASGAPTIAKKVLPVDSSTAQATITANGGYLANVGGFTQFNLCATAFSSGTAVVSLYSTPAPNNSTIAGSSGGGAPSGPAGGDLGGTYPNPTVISVGDVTNGVLAPANGGTASCVTAGRCSFLFPFDRATLITGGGSTATVTAGTVRCGMVQFPAITFTKMSVNVGVTSSGNHVMFGVYTQDRSTLLVQGTFTLGAGTGGLTSTVSSTSLSAGWYWGCYSADNSTATLIAANSVSNSPLIAFNFVNVYWGIAANTASGTTMPSSLGTITSNAANLPVVTFEP